MKPLIKLSVTVCVLLLAFASCKKGEDTDGGLVGIYIPVDREIAARVGIIEFFGDTVIIYSQSGELTLKYEINDGEITMSLTDEALEMVDPSAPEIDTAPTVSSFERGDGSVFIGGIEYRKQSAKAGNPDGTYESVNYEGMKIKLEKGRIIFIDFTGVELVCTYTVRGNELTYTLTDDTRLLMEELSGEPVDDMTRTVRFEQKDGMIIFSGEMYIMEDVR